MIKNYFKGKIPQKIVWCMVIAIALTGCALQNAMVSGEGAPFYLAYNSEEIFRNQSEVATITSTCGLIIDGVEVNRKNMRSVNRSITTIAVADMLPGTHSVTVTNNPDGSPVNIPPITQYFEAGKVYNLTIVISGIIRVKENTSAESLKKIAINRKNAVFD